MSGERGRPDEPEDSVLDSLVRASRAREEDDFRMPDDDTIDAYVHGVATEAQRERVLEALSRSASFRRDIVAMARDLEVLGTREAAARFDAVVVTEAPPPLPGEGPAREGPFGIWRGLLELFLRPAVAYALLAAALAVPVYRWLAPGGIPTGAPVLIALSPRMLPRGGEAGPVDVTSPDRARTVVLLIPVARIPGSERGVYSVTLGGGEGPLIQETVRANAILDAGSPIVPLTIAAGTLKPGKTYDLRVRYDDPGEAFDGAVLYEAPLRVTGPPP